VRLTPSSFANSVRIESDINIQNSADALEFSIPDGKTVFFDGNLTALADTSVSKTGDGLLEISADNSSSFAGDFSIQAGQVTLKSAADLGGNLSIELPATLLAEGSLSADSIAISGHALLKGSTTVSAEITGSGVLDINSQGSIILDSASSTFDGPISVKDGTLEFAGQKVGGSIALSNDTELKFNSASITSFDKDITGAGKVIIGSTQADITLSGLNTYTGGTKIDAATTLKLEDNALQGHVEITGADGVLQIQITEPSKVYSGNISGLGSLEVLTGSNVALTGNLTHTGGTTIAAGAIIQLSDGPISTLGDIASSGTIDFNHTTSNTNYNFTSDISEGDAGKGSIIKSSNQPLTLSGNNSYVSLNITDGNMTLSGSALDVDADINIAKKNFNFNDFPNSKHNF